MKKNYKKPNVKIAFFETKDVISLSNDLEIDIKEKRSLNIDDDNVYLN